MTDERLSLAERFDRAGLQPHQREAAGVSVVLCELVDELIMATNRQTAMVAGLVAAQHVNNRDGQTRSAGDTAGAAAPCGPAEGDDQGGGQVLLREPGLPPADPDGEPGSGPDRAVAEPPAPARAAARKPPAKTAPAKKAAPAKTPTATREGRNQ